jgi:myo-inositol catabolism protein IolS
MFGVRRMMTTRLPASGARCSSASTSSTRPKCAWLPRMPSLLANALPLCCRYGDGYSEDVLGRALAACAAEFPRSSYYVATKASESHLSPALLRSAVQASLARLASPYIDLYQIHWHSRAAVRSQRYPERPLEEEVPLEETLLALQQLQREGLIKHIGVCNFGPEDLQHALHIGVPIVSNQICYNLLWRGCELSGLMSLCQDNQISVLAWSPLQQGLLTGKFSRADDVPSGRARTRLFSRGRAFQRHGEDGQEAEVFSAIAHLNDAVACYNSPAASRSATGASPCEETVTLATASLAWVLCHPAVACALVGARDASQVHIAVATAGRRSVYRPLLPCIPSSFTLSSSMAFMLDTDRGQRCICGVAHAA